VFLILSLRVCERYNNAFPDYLEKVLAIGAIVLMHILERQKESLQKFHFENEGQSIQGRFATNAVANVIQQCHRMKKNRVGK
jgi:hypothetical protein